MSRTIVAKCDCCGKESSFGEEPTTAPLPAGWYSVTTNLHVPYGYFNPLMSITKHCCSAKCFSEMMSWLTRMYTPPERDGEKA